MVRVLHKTGQVQETIPYKTLLERVVLWPIKDIDGWYVEVTNYGGKTIHTTETLSTKHKAVLAAKRHCKYIP